MNKTIVITGANGFIGRYLIEFFNNKGYHVVALIHRAYKIAIPGVDYRQFDLDSFAGDVITEDTEAILHAAYIPYKKGNNSDMRNLKGTKRLLDIARRKKVRKFIYLSSFSATEDALSHYGKNKYKIEKLFDENTDLIIRPGLVVGNGGLYKNIKSIIIKSSMIPLIGGGRQPVQTIEIYTLAQAIQGGIEKDISGFHNVAKEKPIYIKDLYKLIAEEQNKRVKFIPLPYFLATLLIYLMEIIMKQPPVTIENLNGLKQMKGRDVTDTKTFFNPS